MPQTVRDRPQRFVIRRNIEPRSGFWWTKARSPLCLHAFLLVWGVSAIALAPLFAQSPPALAENLPQNPVEQTVAPLMDEKPIQTKNLLGVLRDGGPMMLPIAACSFLLLVFVFERAVSLRRGHVIPQPFVKRFLTQLREQQLDQNTAWELCEENQSAVSVVFAAAVKKWGRPAVEIEQSVIDAGERVTTGLRKYLRLFNGICTISPMLGLLGTVFGMIQSFNSIATSNAMGRPDLLASGIGEALLTTAAGLCVAIPAMIVYLFFVSRVDKLIVEIDSLSQEVVELIASDSWHKEEEEEKPKRRLKAA